MDERDWRELVVKANGGETMELLRLTALDEEDLKVISAHMQDAVMRVCDISYMPGKERFVVLANRFEWLSSLRGEHDKPLRSRTGLHFEHVRSVKCRNIRQERRDGVLCLLAITFHPAPEPPGGCIDLIFSGDGVIRLEVECIEAWLEDLGQIWEAGCCPDHRVDED